MLTSILTLALPLLAVHPADLASAIERYRAGRTPEERTQALDAMAGSGVPVQSLVPALALGLREDDEIGVREHAVQLLAQPERILFALAPLAEACERQGTLEAGIQDKLDELVEDAPQLQFGRVGSSAHKKAFEKQKKKLEVFLEEVEALQARADAVARLRSALLEALISVEDDQAVSGLVGLSESTALDSSSDALVDALIDRGTRPAIGGVSGIVQRYGEVLDGQKKMRRSLQRAKPRKVPKGYDKDAWKASEEKRLQARLLEFEEKAAEQAAWIETVGRRLYDFAIENDLSKPRMNDPLSVAHWKSWWKRTEAELPLSLEPDAAEGGAE